MNKFKCVALNEEMLPLCFYAQAADGADLRALALEHGLSLSNYELQYVSREEWRFAVEQDYWPIFERPLPPKAPKVPVEVKELAEWLVILLGDHENDPGRVKAAKQLGVTYYGASWAPRSVCRTLAVMKQHELTSLVRRQCRTEDDCPDPGICMDIGTCAC